MFDNCQQDHKDTFEHCRRFLVQCKRGVIYATIASIRGAADFGTGRPFPSSISLPGNGSFGILKSVTTARSHGRRPPCGTLGSGGYAKAGRERTGYIGPHSPRNYLWYTTVIRARKSARSLRCRRIASLSCRPAACSMPSPIVLMASNP